MQSKKSLWTIVMELLLMVLNHGVLVISLLVDNSSSIHSENYKNRTNSLRWYAKKNFGINFNKSKTKFCLSFHYNGDAIYLCVNKTQTFKFKGIDNISLSCLVQEAYLKVLQKMQQKDIALSGADMVFQLTTEWLIWKIYFKAMTIWWKNII